MKVVASENYRFLWSFNCVLLVFTFMSILLISSSRRFFHTVRPPQHLALDLQALLIFEGGYVWGVFTSSDKP